MKDSGSLIKKNGISKCRNKKVGYFTQFASNEKIKVPHEKPDVEQITSVIVDPEIISVRVINTPKGTSVEGQSLTGKKLSVEVKLNQKILYVADVPSQSVHVMENTYITSTYIVIPECIKGSRPEELLECKLLRTEVFVEDIFVEKVDKRTVNKNIHLLIEVQVVPTYEICYTEEHNCTNSNLFAVHENGTMKKQLTFFEDCKVYNPEWSPSGQNLAFLLKHKNCCSLYTVPCSNGTPKQATDDYIFPYVSSYCWSNQNNLVYFTAFYEGTKDIFSLNLHNCEWKRLTYGNRECKNYKPKCSPEGSKIAFLKSISNEVNLYTINPNGLGTKRITNRGHIKDFCWTVDGKSIVYVVSKEGCHQFEDMHTLNATVESGVIGDNIYVIDTQDFERKYISIYNKGLNITQVAVSPDSRYISFLGKNFSGENVYLYDLIKNELLNLTNNDCDIEVKDYTWDSDSTKIYFSANDLFFFNLYSIELCNGIKTQISNTNSNGMQVVYRPKLI